MTKLTTDRLETIATWREKYGNGANVMIPAEEAELMARQILAYEQAAKNPVAWNHTKLSERCGMTTPLYAAPVLPKQPVKPVMFIDGDISSDDVEKLAAVIREFGNEPASAQPVIPEMTYVEAIKRGIKTSNRAQWIIGYNAAIEDGLSTPTGWQLVPVKPTPAMLVALWVHRVNMRGVSENKIAQVGYAAMLAAAPAQESE